MGGQRRRDDPTRVGIDADVQFAPRSPPARAVLLDQPLAGTAQLKPSAVHQQMHGFGAGRRSRHGQRLAPPAQRGMVRDGEIETKQMDDGADQPFGLPQGQPEHRPQGQRRRDRQGRIARLAARCGARLGPPGRDRLFAEPHRQTATPPQGSIIFRPVGYPILLLGDVVTAIGIGLEWHGGHPGRLWVGPPMWDCATGFAARGGFGAVQPRPATAKSRSRKGGPSSTLPGPRPQPA